MTELELKSFLRENFPKENENCEWKEFKSLKNSINGSEKDDLVSYVSAISNMGGGYITVSYTHLDVYKRQALCAVPKASFT